MALARPSRDRILRCKELWQFLTSQIDVELNGKRLCSEILVKNRLSAARQLERVFRWHTLFGSVLSMSD